MLPRCERSNPPGPLAELDEWWLAEKKSAGAQQALRRLEIVVQNRIREKKRNFPSFSQHFIWTESAIFCAFTQ